MRRTLAVFAVLPVIALIGLALASASQAGVPHGQLCDAPDGWMIIAGTEPKRYTDCGFAKKTYKQVKRRNSNLRKLPKRFKLGVQGDKLKCTRKGSSVTCRSKHHFVLIAGPA